MGEHRQCGWRAMLGVLGLLVFGLTTPAVAAPHLGFQSHAASARGGVQFFGARHYQEIRRDITIPHPQRTALIDRLIKANNALRRELREFAEWFIEHDLSPPPPK